MSRIWRFLLGAGLTALAVGWALVAMFAVATDGLFFGCPDHAPNCEPRRAVAVVLLAALPPAVATAIAAWLAVASSNNVAATDQLRRACAIAVALNVAGIALLIATG